jgi:hypothetical protein
VWHSKQIQEYLRMNHQQQQNIEKVEWVFEAFTSHLNLRGNQSFGFQLE